MCDEFKELIQAWKDTSKLLDCAGDSKTLFSVADEIKEDVEVANQQNLNMKRIHQALLALLHTEEKSNSKCFHQNIENGEVISSLQEENARKVEEIENLNSQLHCLENTIKETESVGVEIRKEKYQIQKKVTDALPKTKYSFSLYSNITRLRWDYDSGDDKLQGFVTSLQDVRPFSLDLKDHSDHFIANYLWDVIASAVSSQK